MAVFPLLSFNESQQLTVLRAFILGVCGQGAPIEVIKAQVNRVPEPRGANFIIMTPLLQRRLGTNDATYEDNICVGSIAAETLTVTAITQGSLSTGLLLIDNSYPTMRIAPNTQIISQDSGSPGGIGEYTVSVSQNLSEETLYAGLRSDMTAVEWTVQFDFHGPTSGDNARIFEQLFRSDWGVSQFNAILETDGLTDYSISPLYSSDIRQMVFENAEQQQEERWTLDAVMMISPMTGVPQQFATQVKIEVVEAGVVGPT